MIKISEKEVDEEEGEEVEVEEEENMRSPYTRSLRRCVLLRGSCDFHEVLFAVAVEKLTKVSGLIS